MSSKIQRKFFAHFFDTEFNTSTDDVASAVWYRIGEDLEEYNVELNPDVEVTKNILGTTTIQHNGYEIQGDSDPYYAREGDALFEKLQDIADTQATGDELKTLAMEVHLWDGDATAGYAAYVQECYLVPNSYGGDTSGYQIPFSVYYTSEKVAGTYLPSTGVFTAS